MGKEKSHETKDEIFELLKSDPGAHYRYKHRIACPHCGHGCAIKLDPFRISQIYGHLPAPLFTILKKVLVCGGRGHNSYVEDLEDIIGAAERAIEMAEEDERGGIS